MCIPPLLLSPFLSASKTFLGKGAPSNNDWVSAVALGHRDIVRRVCTEHREVLAFWAQANSCWCQHKSQTAEGFRRLSLGRWVGVGGEKSRFLKTWCFLHAIRNAPWAMPMNISPTPGYKSQILLLLRYSHSLTVWGFIQWPLSFLTLWVISYFHIYL